ncbi:MAG: phosphopantetheine-binding protein [bacterium]|nr:phosphopantetheine-binding protein [bacterium]
MQGQETSDDDSLEGELKSLIVETLKLEDISAKDIESEMVLFGAGLGLDSIDALELGIAIQKKYGVKFDAKDQNMQHNFSSVRNLAKFVAASKV